MKSGPFQKGPENLVPEFHLRKCSNRENPSVSKAVGLETGCGVGTPDIRKFPRLRSGLKGIEKRDKSSATDFSLLPQTDPSTSRGPNDAVVIRWALVGEGHIATDVPHSQAGGLILPTAELEGKEVVNRV